ncbi:MAG: hypothetical protein ACKOGJ_02295 [Phycisphaerales bacterium]
MKRRTGHVLAAVLVRLTHVDDPCLTLLDEPGGIAGRDGSGGAAGRGGGGGGHGFH